MIGNIEDKVYYAFMVIAHTLEVMTKFFLSFPFIFF